MGLASFDVRRWNLPLAAVAAAGLACGPTVAPEGEGETDTDPTAATTYDGYDYYDDYPCGGTAGCCYEGDCYDDPYECTEDVDCGPQGLCTEARTCQATTELLDCETTTEVVPLELPIDLAHSFTSLAFVEVDGDPGQELVVGRLGRTELYLGPEPTPVELPWDGNDAVLDAVSGDFDGNGTLDLVLPTLRSLLVMTSDGAGGYTLSVDPSLSLPSKRVEALQWDGDGLLDLAGLGFDGQVQILLGNGVGSFVPYASLPDPSEIQSLARGRFGGDAQDDLVAHYSLGDTTVYLGSAAGDIDADASLLGELYQIRRLLSGAIGGGADDEIVSHAPAGMAGTWSLLELWTDGTGTPQLYALDGSIEQAAMGDIDGDGVDDVVVSDITTMSYLRGSSLDGGASLACRAIYSFPGTVDALEVGDLDGNGRADVAYASQGVVTVLLTQ